jgi:RNA polymerase sigma factor (sigma-70 family)
MCSRAEQQRSERVRVLAERLYRERYRHLLRIAVRNADNREDAAEAVQFAFLAFLQKYDPDAGAPPLAWLSLVAKREAWAKRKRQHLDRRVGQEATPGSPDPGFSVADIPAESVDAEETLERAEWTLEARQRLAALKPDQRRALVLLGAGLSYREVGQVTGFSYTKTNRVITEGRTKLRQPAA